MYEPTRGGTRYEQEVTTLPLTDLPVSGGQAEFKWADVSADKDREVRIFFNPSIKPFLTRSSYSIISE